MKTFLITVVMVITKYMPNYAHIKLLNFISQVTHCVIIIITFFDFMKWF